MKCDLCEMDAMFVVHLDQVRFLCERHLARYDEFPFERVGESPLVRASLDEAERILNALLAGRVVRFVHPKHSEIHWAIWDRERDVFVEKVVNSLTGEVLPLFEFSKLQDYFELLGKSIASGWIAVITNFQPDEICSDGGER
jgi:hypothetical protein